MKFKYIIMAVAASVFTVEACNKTTQTDPEEEESEEVDPTPETPDSPDSPEEPEEEWTGDYPKGVTVESFTDKFSDGKSVNGFVATIDFSANSRLRFNTALASVRKVPTKFFSDFNSDKGKPYIAVNAGYFANSTSVSLCIVDGKVRSNSFVEMNWPNDENCQRQIYPVRSALGLMEDGKFDIEWEYCTNVGSRTQTAFPSTMGNNEKTQTFLDARPSADAEGAFTWTPVQAVGAGPRLLKDGVDVSEDSYWGECLDAGGTAGFSRQPRTAMGFTEDNKLIIIVCDGRGMGGSAGMTLAEMASKMKSLGAVQAMNFDGGGSSQIVGFEGKILNNPSDGSERRVVTAVIISEMPKE